MSLRPLVLGTRSSALALAQARLAQAALAAAHPGQPVELREFKTTGDKRLDLSLASAVHGNAGEKLEKGLFTKELEDALLAGSIDFAVHSLKDLPTANPEGLVLPAVLPRGNTADVLIGKNSSSRGGATADSLSFLSVGARVATSSVRRALQLQYLRPDLQIVDVRGNVGTRLAKLRDQADWAGLVLAQAGLERLGFDLSSGVLAIEGASFSAHILGPEIMLPAVGQGAIALQARASDDRTLTALQTINHPATFVCVMAERELLRALGGGCQAPVGVSSRLRGTVLEIQAIYFSGGSNPRRAAASGDAANARDVALEAARQLLGD